MGEMLSKHVSLDDVIRSNAASRLKINNTPCPAALEQLKNLSNNLIEKIIAKAEANGLGVFSINSSYRCPTLNDAIGGSPTSQHMKGEAMDMSYYKNRVADTDKNKKLHDLIYNMVKNKEITIGQLIDEKNYSWVHVSLGTKNQALKWNGETYFGHHTIVDS